MHIDSIDYDELPDEKEGAFIAFVEMLNHAYERDSHADLELLTDGNGEYVGSYEPEREYVTVALAFIDEFGIDLDVSDISELNGINFRDAFKHFQLKLKYLKNRYKMRRNKIAGLASITRVTINHATKIEISNNIETIRKIINQKVSDEQRKEELLRKLSSLQSEIDREITTLDAVTERMLKLSQDLDKDKDELRPAKSKLDQITSTFLSYAQTIEKLPKPDRRRAITKHDGGYSSKSIRDIDDEIPF